MQIIKRNTSNFTQGRQATRVDRIVIHWIGAGSVTSTINWFNNPNSQVSAHYLVGNNKVYQFVNELDTSWHAGNWDMNKRSIGIEHDAKPGKDLSEENYRLSGELIRDICQRWNIPINREHIIGHQDVKPTQCPGTIDIAKIISIAKGGVGECEEKIQDLEEELSDMRDSRNDWRNKQKVTEDQLEVCQKKNADHTEHIENLQKSQAEMNQQLTAATTQLRNQEADVKRKLEEINTLTEQKELLESKFEASEGKLKKASEDLKKTKQKLKEKCPKAISYRLALGLVILAVVLTALVFILI